MSYTLRTNHTFDFDSSGALNRSSVAKAYSAAVTSGDLLVCLLVVGDNTVTGTSVSDSVNGTWTKGVTLGATGTLSRIEIWYFPNTGAGTPTVTGSWGANRTFSGIFIADFGGVATSTPADGTGGTADPNVSAASLSVSLTAGSAGDLVVMGGGCFNGGSTLTAQSPSTMIDTDGSGEVFWMYQTPAGSGTISSQVNLSPNDKAAGVTYAFTAGGGGGGGGGGNGSHYYRYYYRTVVEEAA